MTSMFKYFRHQMSKNMHPGAVEKLFKKIMPQMCIDNDICPDCSADLIPHEDFRSPFMDTKDRVCTQCGVIYKGDDVAIYRRPNTKPQAFVQPGAADKRA